jgi:hypothetical protein
MKKKLFFAAMLVAPSLAYSADLTVQVVPAASSPAVPAGAQAAGFTTLAANYDFTQPLPSNWLGCSPWDGQPYHGIRNRRAATRLATSSRPSIAWPEHDNFHSYAALGTVGSDAGSVAVFTMDRQSWAQSGLTMRSMPFPA